LPDLFHGSQLVVIGRFHGHGHAAIKLTGNVGKDAKEFVYEINFPERTTDDKGFVEDLWARRKVGYLLDQIRANGEQKELVTEVTALAKKYGITTPYTSWLIVPDAAVPVVTGPGGAKPDPGRETKEPPPVLYLINSSKPVPLEEFAKKVQEKPGDLADNRGKYQDQKLKEDAEKGAGKGDAKGEASKDAMDKKNAYDEARRLLANQDRDGVQKGKLGVDLSVQMNNLRNQSRLEQTAYRTVAGRNCVEIGGVWIDEGFDAKMKIISVKAQSDAYFRILERQPKIKEVFQLGNHVVWVTPNGTALVIDMNHGKEKLDDAEIDQLFVAKK